MADRWESVHISVIFCCFACFIVTWQPLVSHNLKVLMDIGVQDMFSSRNSLRELPVTHSDWHLFISVHVHAFCTPFGQVRCWAARKVPRSKSRTPRDSQAKSLDAFFVQIFCSTLTKFVWCQNLAAGGVSDCCSMPVNQSFQFRDSPEVSHNGWHQMFHMCHYPFAILFAPWNTWSYLNINYLVSFACSACWPFISTGNEEPALDKSIACTTQASQASILSYRCALQGYPVGALVTCSKRTMAGRVTSTAQNELQNELFDIFDEKAFNKHSTVISCQQAFVSPYSEVFSDTQ